MSTQKEIVLITAIGPAAVGKGTEAKKLHAHFGDIAVHRESGGAIRGALKGDPEFAHFKNLLEPHVSAMQRGDLLPDEIVHTMITERLNLDFHDDGRRIAIIDGIPRNLNQLAMYDEWVDSLRGRGFNVIEVPIFFAAPVHIPIKRAEDRRIKAGPNARKDDAPEAVKARWSVYKDETYPVAKLLRDQGRLHVVRANRDEPLVHAAVLDILEYRLRGSSHHRRLAA